MGFIAPKERKHLSADALFGFVRSLFANVPDHRSDDTDMTLTDALMAGFAMFSLKCPSLLDFDKQRAEGNLKTIYSIARAPCDSSMREMLDPVAPESLRPLFLFITDSVDTVGSRSLTPKQAGFPTSSAHIAYR